MEHLQETMDQFHPIRAFRFIGNKRNKFTRESLKNIIGKIWRNHWKWENYGDGGNYDWRAGDIRDV